MTGDYLIMPDGRRLRVEINWNTLVRFIEETGCDLAEIGAVQRDIKMMRKLAYLAICEGEALEKREFSQTEEEFGSGCRAEQIISFIQIMNKHQDVGADNKKKQGTAAKAAK